MKTYCNCAAEAAAACLDRVKQLRYVSHLEQECFLALPLDAKNRLIGAVVLVAVGSATTVEVHPRDVFRAAIRRNAASLIVAHTHPSGDCEPSREDLRLTERLKQSGQLLGIPVLDHIIFRRSEYVSLQERGRL